ncbi:hypothetical protein H310_10541 [Aphanomyces invadans]|uniref:PX domain-containing protein n=1 Tax=Aphanomyces invadans TaxID=157072 RepID=A0A024TQW1_9STRA|nr:hypothetical protein H310_10541 [Aphanomyces invadans]ETV96388.1 hypothetical protein H310_10541 [Aphanomyces invadans]|eukprot:XP_008875180.1 hypothetical protein H310_10541 [Aphanomyces invadans]
MGQVVSCCFGTPDLEETLQHPREKVGCLYDERASQTVLCESLLPAAALVVQRSDACTATSEEYSPFPASIRVDIERMDSADGCEGCRDIISVNDHVSIECHPCVEDEELVPETEAPPKLATQRSRSTSDMLTDTSLLRPLWGRSTCNRNLLDVDKDPTTTSLTVDDVRINWFAVTVQHFTPHLTGSVYDFCVTVYGHPTPLLVSHTRHACKAFYAKLQKLRRHHITKKLLPPFPPKAGLGLIKTSTIDANSCSFMQDFLNHLLAIPDVRNAAVTLAFFHVADPFVARAS